MRYELSFIGRQQMKQMKLCPGKRVLYSIHNDLSPRWIKSDSESLRDRLKPIKRFPVLPACSIMDCIFSSMFFSSSWPSDTNANTFINTSSVYYFQAGINTINYTNLYFVKQSFFCWFLTENAAFQLSFGLHSSLVFIIFNRLCPLLGRLFAFIAHI